MGIPSFFGKIIRGWFGASLSRRLPRKVNSLSLDMNSIFHNIAAIIYGYGDGIPTSRKEYVAQMNETKKGRQTLENELFEAIGNEILSVVSMVNPDTTLILAVDGVAPQAKIQQQRQRRFRAALDSKRTSSGFDSNCITPGTEFMFRLDTFLTKWISRVRMELPPNVCFYGHLTPGEGEHKIVKLMRSTPQLFGFGGAHVIWGLDADLIMLGLLSPLPDIFLFRDDKTGRPPRSYFLSISELKNEIKNLLGSKETIEHVIDDFVLMFFFVGNDFLPHLPTFHDMEDSFQAMFRTYQTIRIPLTNENTILWENVSIFLKQLSKKHEHVLLAKNAKHSYEGKWKNRWTLLERSIDSSGRFDTVSFSKSWYEHTLGPAYMIRGEMTEFDKLIVSILDVNVPVEDSLPFTSTPSRISELCVNYIIGIAWVYRYYRMGSEYLRNDYVFKYSYGPLLTDIAEIAGTITSFTDHESINDPFLHCVHQLLAVLPEKSKTLLPVEVQKLVSGKSAIGFMYPEMFLIDRSATSKEYQGLTLIAPVSGQKLIDVVRSKVGFSEERISDFVGKAFISTLKKEELEFDKLKRYHEQRNSRRSRGNERESVVNVTDENYQRDSNDYQPRVQRGNYENNRGRGTRGNYENNRGRGNYENNRGRGNYENNRGRGTRGRGNYENNRGRGTRGRGNYENNRGRGTRGRGTYENREITRT